MCGGGAQGMWNPVSVAAELGLSCTYRQQGRVRAAEHWRHQTMLSSTGMLPVVKFATMWGTTATCCHPARTPRYTRAHQVSPRQNLC